MTWDCAAIDHGVTIFPNGKIGPCCQISAEYLKPISFINRPDRFSDLKTEYPPSACEKCVRNEYVGVPSYRHFFNDFKNKNTKGIAFLDLRNTNQCNLKCRYCGPHFSNQWARELDQSHPLHHVELSQWRDILFTDDLQMVYFTGGEPLISHEHWDIVQHLVNINLAGKVSLMYNTNLTQIRYKDLDIIDLWRNFKSVNVMVSADAIGQVFDNIRSGAKWDNVDQNITVLTSRALESNIHVSITCVLSILNIWHLDRFIQHFLSLGLKIQFILLDGPDYLALDVIPDRLKQKALDMIVHCINLYQHPVLQQAKNRILDNQNQVLFRQCLSHVLLLDNLRQETLFNLLPFREVAQDLITNNNEYK